MNMRLMVKYLFILLTSVLLFGCKYTLSGIDDIEARTALVSYFENQAPIQSAELSQIFTNKLEMKIIQETPLSLVKNEPEVSFSGAIVGYALSPAAVSGTETTEQTQLRVTVNVEYINTLDEEQNFNQSFSATETYDASMDLSSVETQLLESITDQIVQAIFNRAFINW